MVVGNALLNGSVDVINAVLCADYDAVIKHQLVRKLFSSYDKLKQISNKGGEKSATDVILTKCVNIFLCSDVGVESEIHLR